MEKRTQLTVMLENKPGALGRVVGALAKANVNLQAISINDGVHHGLLKLVPDQPALARKALQDEGLPFSEQKVYAIAVADRPGALAEVCSLFADKGINIEYIYGGGCTCGEGCECGCDAVLILSLPDPKAAEAVLQGKKSTKAKKTAKRR